MPAPDLTKAQIDALVAKMNHEHTDGRVDDWTRLGVGPGSNVVHRHNLTTALYLAAGLTAEGTEPQHPMPTTQGYAIVDNEGGICVSPDNGKLVYAIYGTDPGIRPGMEAVRRVARVEIREVE